MEDLILDPHVEENFAMLKSKKKNDEWHGQFGRTVYEYFEYVAASFFIAQELIA
jgi:hypothetical protein